MDPHRLHQFEQISAYIDGELCDAEAREVEGWLAEDPELERFYQSARRLQLEQQLLSPTAEELSSRVFDRLDRSRTLVGGGVAVALVVLGFGCWKGLELWLPAESQVSTLSGTIAETAASDSPALTRVARRYLLTEELDADPYSILLQRQDVVLLTGR